MTSASKGGGGRKGVQLDPNDPVDRQIIARQVAAARQAGREGRDRAATTRGRADLEAAYDEGAADEAQPTPAGAGDGGGQSAGSRPSAARSSLRASRGRGWKAFKPTSPARLPTRLADAGGFGAGLALYTVVVIYIRYGPAGWKGWLSAKFLNKPMVQGATGALGSKPVSKKTGGSLAV